MERSSLSRIALALALSLASSCAAQVQSPLGDEPSADEASDEDDAAPNDFEIASDELAQTVVRRYCRSRSALGISNPRPDVRACLTAPGRLPSCNEWHEPVAQDRFCTPWVRGPATCTWHLNWWVRDWRTTFDDNEWNHVEHSHTCGQAQSSAGTNPALDDLSAYEEVTSGGTTRRRYCRERGALGISSTSPDVKACITAPGMSAVCNDWQDSARALFCTPWEDGSSGCTWHLNWWVRNIRAGIDDDDFEWIHTTHTHTCPR